MKKKLFNKNFVLLWQGQTISMLGNQVFSIATIFWIKHLTGSASLIALIGMISTIPAVILVGFGGAFADRYSRRNIVIFCDLIMGIAIVLLAAMLFFMPNEHNMLITAFIIVSVFEAVVNSFFQPAVSAAIPDIVPEDKITAANSLGQTSAQLSTFIGQGLGGVLFRILGAPILIFFNGISYLIASFSEIFITIPQKIPERSESWKVQASKIKEDLVIGFRYVWEKSGLKKLILLFSVLNFLTVPMILLLPFYVEDHLKVSVDWYGFLLAAYGAGSIIGYVIAGIIKLKGNPRGFVVLISIVLLALGFALLGFITSAATAIVLAVISGAINGYFSVNVVTMLQITTPSDIRGRVFGFLTALAGAMAPLGMGMAGVIFDLTGKNIPLIYGSCGSVMLVVALAALNSRDLRKYLSYTEPEKTEQELVNEPDKVNDKAESDKVQSEIR